MTKITLSNVADLTSSTTAQSTINTNSSVIQTAFDNTLSRDGTSPNTMGASLDMNSNRVLNLPGPVSGQEPLRLQDYNTLLSGGTINTLPVGGVVGEVLVKNSSTNYDVGWSANPADNAAGLNITLTGTNPVTIATVTNPAFTSPTLTTPIISSITNTGTLTLPTSSDTLVGRATTDTLTNKTFDTAGTGNSFKINGTAITAKTGTGSAVLATSPILVTPVLGAATATSLTFSPTTGGIVGTTTNDDATAGKVGEYVSSQILVGSAVSVSNNTATNVTSISLTAGDWDVWGNVAFSPAGTTTVSALFAFTSTVSATVPTIPNNGAQGGWTLPFTTGATQIVPCGMARVSLASTTTVFLEGFATFGVSTMSAYGFIGARRVR